MTNTANQNINVNGNVVVPSEVKKINYKNIRVGSTTNPKKLAKIIESGLNSDHEVVITGVGAQAINQIQKAIAIASGPLSTLGYDIWAKPFFQSIEMSKTKDTKTGLGFKIKKMR